MKAITGNLMKFSAILFVLTIVFRFALSAMLKNEEFTYIWVLSVGYALIIFVFGWIFGKKEKETLPLFDIGFRFHLATYIICNLIAELWYLFNFQSVYEHIKSVHLTVLFWGLGLLLHFVLYLITRKHAIKGLKKTEIFE